MKPDASIVVLNYNYAEFLMAAIDSALVQQQSAAVEVIVVDDGSTDGSRDVIGRYGRRIIPVLKGNGGVDTAVNAGYARTQADVVVFLDADDVLLPQAVQQLLPYFLDKRVAKVHWAMPVLDREGKRTGDTAPAYELAAGDLRDAILLDGPDACHSAPMSGNAWTRWVLEKILPIPECGFKGHADSYLGVMAPIWGPVRRLDTSLSLYRLHGRNTYASLNTEEKNRRNLAIYDELCRVLADALGRQGAGFDRARWEMGRNEYLWMQELGETVARVIPPATPFILIDEDQWVRPPRLAAHRPLPFPQRDGQYGGPPVDSGSAIREAERLCAAGVKFLVVAWPAFWWLRHYTEFHSWLRERFLVVNETATLVVFAANEGSLR